MAENPLIFPPDDVLAKLKIFKGLSEDEETATSTTSSRASIGN